MTRFLITGAKGQVGQCLVSQLEGKGELLALGREDLDISCRDQVFQVIHEFCPDVVINAAAYTAVDRAEEEANLAQKINLDGAKYLAEASHQVGAMIFHLSTDYVFNGRLTNPYVESDVPDPQNVYGQTKLASEIAVRHFNPRAFILRTAWVFAEQGNNFVKTMLRLAKKGENLAVVADQIGSPTYAGDIATAIIQMANRALTDDDLFGIYHFSGFPYVSWYAFAERIFEEAEVQNVIKKRPLVKAISTQDYPTLAKRPTNSRLNCSKIQQVFGIQPSDWQRALQNLQGYERNNAMK
ncbi:NAD(P)-dependent oxidoreductase [Pasteurellaceae bacterium Macca]|nr:NAD(P)-dependent oxidoreductase [Pasteurellaceae bacterium Macca]